MAEPFHNHTLGYESKIKYDGYNLLIQWGLVTEMAQCLNHLTHIPRVLSSSPASNLAHKLFGKNVPSLM